MRSVRSTARAATWRREGGELTIRPRAGLRRGANFIAVIAYDGVPAPGRGGLARRQAGFIHTDDGALVAGEPHVAATWYPVNEHPRDKARYSFRIGVPRGVEAIANGDTEGRRHTAVRGRPGAGRRREPMASYLSTATIGAVRHPTLKVGRASNTSTRSTPICSSARAADRAPIAVTGHPPV